jgi:AtzE family amidohydrolase
MTTSAVNTLAMNELTKSDITETDLTETDFTETDLTMNASVMNTSATDIVRRIRSGAISALQVLAETRARIDAFDPQLNCFTATTFERAEREAAAIDALRAAGKPLPPLAGVPYAVKNLFDIDTVVTLAGAKVNEGNAPADADACLIARMHAAGAVLVGALNMDEHAYGFTTENTYFGATRNPHDLKRIAGGSSGGSAAAVAAGLVPLTLGSDTNGSIRVPASLCGIFGLKPTYGRLPRSGSFPFVDSFDHLGPFATNVADLTVAYNALQGPDQRDHACAQRLAEPVSATLTLPSGLRVGVLGGWFDDWAGDQAKDAVQRVASALGALDTVSTVRSVELKGAEAARSAAFTISGAEGGALHSAQLRSRYDDYEPLSRDRLVAGSLIPATWVVQAQRLRQQVYREALALFEQFDLLIAPATPVSAPLIGTDNLLINGNSVPARASMGLLTQPISCIGLPVCAVPIWPQLIASGTLPIGVQLIAAPWREDICLAAAAQLERIGVASFRLPAAFGGRSDHA